MTDDMLRALSKNGGVVMINYNAAFLSEEYRAATRSPELDPLPPTVLVLNQAREHSIEQSSSEFSGWIHPDSMGDITTEERPSLFFLRELMTSRSFSLHPFVPGTCSNPIPSSSF